MTKGELIDVLEEYGENRNVLMGQSERELQRLLESYDKNESIRYPNGK